MGCIFRARMNHLWSVWYTVTMVLLQAYLLYLGFERYRLYSEMKWPHGAYPRVWLSVYVILYSICLPGLLLFAAFGIFKSGNIAGDNDRLGARTERIIEMSSRSKQRSRGRCSLIGCAKAMWEHGPPLPQQLHLLIALFQLFAQQMMLAQLYRYGFINSGDFLNTELDFAYQRVRQLANNLPMLDNRLQGFRMTKEDLSGNPVAPNLLPVLMHSRLFGIPLEFVNLLIALFAYACSYPSVFWRVSKPFSFFFSTHLLVHVAIIIWSYLGFSVLYRIQETNYASVRPVGLGQYLSASKALKIYHPLAIIATYVATMILINIAPIALYAYGYNKFFVNLLNVQYRNAVRSQGSCANGPPSEYSDFQRRSYLKQTNTKLCCDGYGPHIVAIILLVLIVVVKAPTIYALMVIYQHDEKPLLLSCIVVDIVYLFTWIIFWLILTLKRDWNFKVMHEVREIVALQNGRQTVSGISGSVMDKNVSELKNALILMHGEQLYITDDPVAKQSVLRYAQKSGMGTRTDEVYWLKANGGQSPTARKIPLNESRKGTPELNRLLGGSAVHRQSSDENSTPTGPYHSITRSGLMQGIQPPPQHQATMTLSKHKQEMTPPEERNAGNTFGTLQRNQRSEYIATLSRQQGQGQQRCSHQNTQGVSGANSVDYGRVVITQPETYASIHKSAPRNASVTVSDIGATQRKGSIGRDDPDNSTYSNLSGTYASTYAAYARLPPQTRAMQNQQLSQQAVTRNAYNSYGMQQMGVPQRMAVEGGVSPSVSSVRASPVIGEDRVGIRTSVASREQSPHQRTTNLKLSSFNSGAAGAESQKQNLSQTSHTTLPPSWTQQRLPAQSMQLPNAQWGKNPIYNKTGSISTSSSQQEQCFTPTSTLTSQGSVSNYSSQHTPTPGSPNLGSTHASYGNQHCAHNVVANSNIYGNIGDDLTGPGDLAYGSIPADRERTLVSGIQKPMRTTVATGSTSVRHQVKITGGARQDDSANYSLTSSNESAENERAAAQSSASHSNEYATSIV